MTDPTLIGMRADDLDPDERDILADLLRDPGARAEHEEALAWGHLLTADVPRSTVPASEILRRARAEDPQGWSPRMLAVLGALAALLLATLLLGSPAPDTRTRGTAPGDAPKVELLAVVDGTPRALGDGAALAGDERVVFTVRASVAGEVVLTEVGARTTEILRWHVHAGDNVLGGAAPLSWRPDDITGGPRRYVVRLCEGGGPRCAEDALSLRW
ncbi:MAG: hypothetical protein KC656_00610 [Myxococcales bacterium]|nr:hypothetical protein [Myxococcales bacterium]MCB9693662.1 hypothetical protein [Alphaproteobacteria bacterium]